MDLARRVFTDGAPAEVEDFYGASDVAVLKQMLASPDQAPYQNTIVSLIGLLSDGSDADAHVLLDFADANSETSAAHSAIISLGYVAERGSRIALDGLKEKTRQTKSQLSKAAVAGLALSGNDEAWITCKSSLVLRPRQRLATSLVLLKYPQPEWQRRTMARALAPM